MKNRKKKLCPSCGSLLRFEKDRALKREYTYVCNSCEQNFYKFEAVKSIKK